MITYARALGACYIAGMKKFAAAALMMLVLGVPAFAKTYKPPKPLHKNAPHTYTKHKADKHPTAVHPKSNHKG